MRRIITLLLALLLLAPVAQAQWVTTNGQVQLPAGPVTMQQLDLTLSLDLPLTIDSTTGVIYKGVSRFLHNYAAATANGKNTFLGLLSGNFTMSPAGGAATLASQNTGVGADTLFSVTTGYENTAVGTGAMTYTTTGNRNTAVGVSALGSNTIGDHNIAFGQNALAFNTEGTYNTALGIDALRANLTGTYNLAVGQNALLSNTTASYNTALGIDALRSNTDTGHDNTAVGAGAAYKNTTGFYNVAVGQSALHENLNHVANTAVGTFAGYNSDANYGVYLGYMAGFYETANNKLFIDNAQRASESDGRAKALVYGIFDASTANQYITFNAHTKSLLDLTIGAYTLPATDGVYGTALVTNGTGTTSWQKVATGTLAATTLYVRTDGNDANTCLVDSPAGACLTIQAALSKVPQFVNHNVTVTVGEGNFAGFCLMGFIVSRTSVFTVQGTLGNPTLTGGTVSGTADGGDTTHCNHSTQSWTVNELRGKLIKVGSEYRVVRENTANTMELVGPLSATCSGKAYELFEQKTVINSDSPWAGTRVCLGVNNNTRESIVLSNFKATGGSYGFVTRGGSGLTNQRLFASGATTAGFINQSLSGESLWYDCYATGNGGYGFGFVEVGGQVRINRIYAYNNSGYYGILIGGPGSCPGSNCNDIYADNNTGWVGLLSYDLKETYGARWFAKGNNGYGILFQANPSVYLSGATVTATIGDGITWTNSSGKLVGCSVSGNSGYGIAINANHPNGADSGGLMEITGTCDVSTNTTGGIVVKRDGRALIGGVTGTGNGTYGVTVHTGGSVEINSATTITGTSGDATINGGTNVLPWSTYFGSNGNTVINTSTGAKIERRDTP